MPIQFNCVQCNNLLRVADETAGQQAKCPQCGMVMLIPDAPPSASAPPPATPGPPTGDGGVPGLGAAPPSRPDSGFSVPPNENPFASPGYAGDAAYDSQQNVVADGRTGPAWERNGPSVSSFVETVKEIFSSPTTAFRTMRREGGHGRPLLFGIIGITLSSVVSMLFQLVVQFGMGGLAAGAGAGNAGFGGLNPFLPAGMGVCMIIGTMIIVPLIAVIQLYISAGITHLMLMMLSAARQPYETTLRVVSYTSGTTSLIQMVPICGPYIQIVVHIVYEILGLMEAHEISGGKATAAVLLPFLICCVGVGGLFAFIFLGAVGAAGGRGGAPF